MFLFLPDVAVDFIAFNCRGLAMLCGVYPLSFVLRLSASLSKISRNVLTLGQTHDMRVQAIVNQVKRYNALGVGGKMCTSRAPWQNLSTRFADYKATSRLVHVGSLTHFGEIDEENLTVHLEPLLSVGEIADYLASKGYMLATTLEIREATIGGLACAVGMTTASHRYGLLQETVVDYEVILANGELVHARADNEHSSLYYCLPWSHGSLGLLVGLTMKIVKIKPYVLVTYTSHDSMESYCKQIRELAWSEVVDFVEATVFSRNKAVVMQGVFTEKKDAPKSARINNVGWWFKPWFYKHVEYLMNDVHHGKGESKELIPTVQYIFRHDRSIFWTVRDQLLESVGNHPIIRFLFGWMGPPMVSFLKLPATKRIKHEMKHERVYQDITLPIHALENSIDLSEKLFNIYPVLVYPSRVTDHGPGKRGLFPWKAVKRNSNKNPNIGMFFDLGVYGIPDAVVKHQPYPAIENARVIEKFTRDEGGAPFLYADTFMSRKEFAETFDMELYEKVRKQYNCEGAFHHVYDKTSSYPEYEASLKGV